MAKKCAKSATVQLSYAIGVIEPVSVHVVQDGGTTMDLEEILETFDLTPKGIIDRLDLRKPIYKATASGGHFGRSEFPWENIL